MAEDNPAFNWLNDSNATSARDYVVASTKGSIINTYEENDIVISGSGDDIIDIGSVGFTDSDTVIFFNNNGNDIVRNFQATAADFSDRGMGDRIGVNANVNGTGVATSEDLLSRTSQSGANTIIDLGLGNSITIENFTVTDLTPANFIVIA